MLMYASGTFKALLVIAAILCSSAAEKGCTYYLPCVDWIVGMIACLGQFSATFACAALNLSSPRAQAAHLA